MNCKQWNETWVAYLYDECSAEENSVVETHLASCAACREHMDALEATRQKLGQAPQEISAPPRVIVLPAAPRRLAGAWGFAGGFAAAAALFVVGIVVGMNGFSGSTTLLEPGELGDLDSAAARDTRELPGVDLESGIQQVRNDYQALDARLGHIESWLPDPGGENTPRLATEDRLHVAVGNIYEQFDVRRQQDLSVFLEAFYTAEQNARQRDRTYRQAIEIINAQANPNVRQR